MFYSEDIKVKYSEMDYRLALKPSSLLNFLQDLASKNAEELGFGYSFIIKKNLGWFLLKYRMEFDDYPIGVYDLTLKTEPRGANKLFAYRDFELYENEKKLGRVSSVWSLVDMESRALAPVLSTINSANMPLYEKRDSDLNFQKIKPLSKIDIEKLYDIRFDDLDVNCHVNNCNYIIWALEPLSFEFRSSHKIKTIDMNFKKEVKFGVKIISQVELISENLTTHVIKNADTNEELCLVSVEWIKI